MTTKELAVSIANASNISNPETVEEIYRRLLLFLANDYMQSYSPMTPDRIAACERAKTYNYFWLPCIICGTWVGGHEEHGLVKLTESEGVGCCSSPACLEEAKRLNELYQQGIQQGVTQ